MVSESESLTIVIDGSERVLEVNIVVQINMGNSVKSNVDVRQNNSLNYSICFDFVGVSSILRMGL